MRRLTTITAALVLASTAAMPQSSNTRPANEGDARLLTSVPANAQTVTNWYKQNVYDRNDTKIGEVKDVLVDQDGRIEGLIVSVGGFLGVGEKDVAVPYSAVKQTKKDNKSYLVMNTTKDALKTAPGFKYDSAKTTWVPDSAKSDRTAR
jgi:sporulation protein YlmC with PRC-barrel domain